MMTRKDFVDLANRLKYESKEDKEVILQFLLPFLQLQNSNFDKARFIAATEKKD